MKENIEKEIKSYKKGGIMEKNKLIMEKKIIKFEKKFLVFLEMKK